MNKTLREKFLRVVRKMRLDKSDKRFDSIESFKNKNPDLFPEYKN